MIQQRVSYKTTLETGMKPAREAGFFGPAPDGVPYATVTVIRDGNALITKTEYGMPDETSKTVADRCLHAVADELRNAQFSLEHAKRSVKEA